VHRINSCVDGLTSCPVDVAPGQCDPPLRIGNFTMSPRQACTLTRVYALQGMAAWRWLLWIISFWPAGTFTFLIAATATRIVNVLLTDGTAVYLTFGLQHQLSYTLRAFTWLGIWFALAQKPLDWAERTSGRYGWNARAGRRVWRSQFIHVHHIVWRCILVFALFSVTKLLSAAAGKALSLQFHEANHFEKMQVRSACLHWLDTCLPNRLAVSSKARLVLLDMCANFRRTMPGVVL
jgi:hypothetical protein